MKASKKMLHSLQRTFRKGMKVTYIGTRNEELKGKVLEVAGLRGPDGVWVRTKTGKRGSAMANRLKRAKAA